MATEENAPESDQSELSVLEMILIGWKMALMDWMINPGIALYGNNHAFVEIHGRPERKKEKRKSKRQSERKKDDLEKKN